MYAAAPWHAAAYGVSAVAMRETPLQEITGEAYRFSQCISGLFEQCMSREFALRHIAAALELLKECTPKDQGPPGTDDEPTSDRVLETVDPVTNNMPGRTA